MSEEKKIPLDAEPAESVSGGTGTDDNGLIRKATWERPTTEFCFECMCRRSGTEQEVVFGHNINGKFVQTGTEWNFICGTCGAVSPIMITKP